MLDAGLPVAQGGPVIPTFGRGSDCVRNHGPFCWGASPAGAVETAIALEAVAAMATRTLLIDPAAGEMDPRLLARHFDRKHGPGAYYGQDDGG